jgi:hypothetical protein
MPSSAKEGQNIKQLDIFDPKALPQSGQLEQK